MQPSTFFTVIASATVAMGAAVPEPWGKPWPKSSDDCSTSTPPPPPPYKPTTPVPYPTTSIPIITPITTVPVITPITSVSVPPVTGLPPPPYTPVTSLVTVTVSAPSSETTVSELCPQGSSFSCCNDEEGGFGGLIGGIDCALSALTGICATGSQACCPTESQTGFINFGSICIPITL